MAARKKTTKKKATKRRSARSGGPSKPSGFGGKSKRVKSWSYSTWSRYDECPKRTYYQKIEKLPDPIGPAGQRGIKIHKKAEDFVKGRLGDEIPKELGEFEEEFFELRDKGGVTAEADYTYTEDWKRTKWNDWDNAWVRMKVDVEDTAPTLQEHGDLLIIDHKTGRKRNYKKQSEVYAIGAFLAHPKVEKVAIEFWYLDIAGDNIELEQYVRDELKDLQLKWEGLVRPMMEDETFEPRPGGQCRYCTFSQHKGGPCEDSPFTERDS